MSKRYSAFHHVWHQKMFKWAKWGMGMCFLLDILGVFTLGVDL